MIVFVFDICRIRMLNENVVSCNILPATQSVFVPEFTVALETPVALVNSDGFDVEH